jgi:hypothetical protein
MAICGCALPASCCQPAVAGGVIYPDLWSELSTHLAQQALFTQSSVHDATATSFPLSKHTGGGDTAMAFSGPRVYLQFTGKWVFPPLLWCFPPTTTFTSFPAPDCWPCPAAPASQHVCLQLTCEVGLPLSPVEFFSLRHSHKLSCFWLLGVPTLSGQARLVYLHFRPDSPPPLFGAQGAPPSLLRVFIVLIAYYSVSLFSPGGGRSVQGAMPIWPRVVCGSTAYH